MSSRIRVVVRAVILVATVVFSWLALLIGQEFTAVQVAVGMPSPQEFVAESTLSIEDAGATERAREEAAAAVLRVYQRDFAIDALVVSNIQAFFESVRSSAVDQRAVPLPVVTTSATVPPGTDLPEATTGTTPAPLVTTSEAAPGATAPGSGPTETTEAATPTTSAGPDAAPTETTLADVPRTSGMTGVVRLRTGGGSTFIPDDQGLGDIRLVAYDSTGVQFADRTLSNGRYSFTGMAAGPAVVLVDTESVPEGVFAPGESLLEERVLFVDRETPIDPIEFEPMVIPRDTQAANLRAAGYSLSDSTVRNLVDVATGDVIRGILGEDLWLTSVQEEVVRLAAETLDENGGILSEELLGRKRELRTRNPFLPIAGVDDEFWGELSLVVTEVASEFLAANKSVDMIQTDAMRNQERDKVDPVFIEFSPGQVIVGQGEEVTEEIEQALEEGGLIGRDAPRYLALASAVVLVVGLLALYIHRFQPSVWRSMRRIALFGLLVTLSALAARGVAVFADDNPVIGYLVPAAAFGLMAVILFDAETTLIMAVVVGSMTAIATIDPGYTLFAILSTLAPVPFVSAISARRDLRRAAIYIMIISAALASVIAWFVHTEIPIYEVAAYALVNGAVSWLIGSSLLSVLEIIFDITTSLRLLDLTDRNHPALRLLEEKAIGSFNHSLMVGTLADRAARAVGANPLLARAAAYYHDLGKTENAQFFIENQFGIQNPHDRMAPERSAEVIRRHVLDGVSLARKFRIPGEVAESVVTHHGDAIMHFFYNRAKELYGADAVDREAYRHAGRKPVRREMAIVMMADSVEGACRAVFQAEEPSPEGIEQLVERVVGEKMADGQLSESEMTLGDLTNAKAAMVDALVGHYHQRIPYPNFPERE
ncbi:MAG: HDIG domain-containing protein [bacterium]|nr:HDIG domain-containing protein [bacterium]